MPRLAFPCARALTFLGMAFLAAAPSATAAAVPGGGPLPERAPLRGEGGAGAVAGLTLALAPGPDLHASAQKADERAPSPGSLDFDLLGEAKTEEPPVDQGALRLRRRMLTAHQAAGFGLLAATLATTVVGQLNYNDKFGGSAPANTGKYRLTHAALSYSTLGLFVGTGTLALFAPSPPKRKYGWDRAMLHRISMAAATAGMAAQAGLGIYTASREGYLDQGKYAKAHLAIGYATLAALLTGVGALTF